MQRSISIPLAAFLISIVVLGGIAVVFWFLYSTDPDGAQTGTSTDEGLFLFGRSEEVGERSLTPTETETDTILFSEERSQRVFQVSDEPVAGAQLLLRRIGSDRVAPRIRYIERATGHIYEVNPDDGTTIKLSNTTLPRIQRAEWFDDATAFIVQYLDASAIHVQTYAARLVPPPEEQEGVVSEEEVRPKDENRPVFWKLDGTFLPEDILTFALAPHEKAILYVRPQSFGSVGVVTSLDGTQSRRVYSSALQELVPQWASESRATLTTRPAAAASGALFTLNPQTETMQLRVSGPPALTTRTNPSGTQALMFSLSQGVPALEVYDFEDDTVQRVTFTTLPEKCVWSQLHEREVYCAVPTDLPSSKFPGAWYQGKLYTSDVIWRINLDTEQTDLIVAPPDFENKTAIDAVELELGPNEEFLLFVNKRDRTLWRIDLRERR